MSSFTAIDLSLLPPPQIVESLDYEAIFSAMLADLQTRDPLFTALVESDPAFKILEVCAYRELLLRQRVNDASRAVMLAYATGSDLDQIGALFNVQRLSRITYTEKVIVSGTLSPNIAGEYKRADNFYGAKFYTSDGQNFIPAAGYFIVITNIGGPYRISEYVDGIATGVQWYASPFDTSPDQSLDDLEWGSPGGSAGGATGVPVTKIVPGDPILYSEPDADFRRRIQLSLEGFSVAGPEGAYVFWTLSASPEVLDASATSPNPGEVLITVLSRSATGAAGAGLLDEVLFTVNSDSIRPLTDSVTAQSAEIIFYNVEAEIFTYPGPDTDLILVAAREALDAYVESVRRIGRDVSLSGIYAALHRPGVQRVNLISPAADIPITETQASFCDGINIGLGGTDE